MRLKEDDIELLLPSFRPYVRELVVRLKMQGYDPLVRDTLRTPEEAARNAKLGTGSKNSIHCYGAAADIICGVHNWDCRDHGCFFFKRLGEAALELGLEWGGTWKSRVDLPHVQAIPAGLVVQARLRALKTEAERDAFIRRYLRPFRATLSG